MAHLIAAPARAMQMLRRPANHPNELKLTRSLDGCQASPGYMGVTLGMTLHPGDKQLITIRNELRL